MSDCKREKAGINVKSTKDKNLVGLLVGEQRRVSL